MRVRELSYLPSPRLIHGGDVRRGKRKLARPIDPRRPLHVVMRSSQARGSWSMLKRGIKPQVELKIRAAAEKFGVKIYRYANVGNHLHMIVRVRTRELFQNFLRVIGGAIAFLVTGTRKGIALKQPFWDRIAFTRIVNWGRKLDVLQGYLTKNLLESFGIQRGSYRWIRVPRRP